MADNVAWINIYTNGKVDHDPCELSKTGQNHPTHVVWANHSGRDRPITFLGENGEPIDSPFEEEPGEVKDGKQIDSGKIKDEAKDRYLYDISTKEERARGAAAADPEIVIKQ